MEKSIFRINDMHCPNCAMRLESIEDDLPGVREISASYKKGQMVVEFDEALINDDMLIAAVTAVGYTAVKVK
jgi:copper chaperone